MQLKPQDLRVSQRTEINSTNSSTPEQDVFPNWSESGIYALYLFLAFLAALALTRRRF